MSPERRAANAELDDVLRRVAPTLDCIDPGEVITAWVLVGHAVMPDDEDHVVARPHRHVVNLPPESLLQVPLLPHRHRPTLASLQRIARQEGLVVRVEIEGQADQWR